MQITQAELDAYTSKLEAQQRAAQVYTETNLRAFHSLNPDVSAEEMTEYAEQLMNTVYTQFGNQAGAVAAQQYDETMAKLGFDVPPAEVKNDVPVNVLNGLTGTFTDMVTTLGANAYDHAHQTANKTTVHNATRDYKRGVRYARVPTGKETCGFCLMLASRGFEYTSAEAAGDGAGLYNWYHRHCDCRVVAGDEDTVVDGYDPDMLYDQYLDARAAVDISGIRDRAWEEGWDSETTNKRITDSIINEINRRNASWAWQGQPGTVTVPDHYEPLRKELDLAHTVASHGFDVALHAPTHARPTANATISGNQTWEFAQPVGTGNQTIRHQFQSAAKKARRLVLDVSEYQARSENWRKEREGIEETVRSLIGETYSNAKGEPVQFMEVLLIGADGYIKRIK